MTPAFRIAASTSRFLRALLALLLAVGGWCAGATDVAPRAARATSTIAAAGDELPTGELLVAMADGHEECALVEGAPESSDDDAALVWPWPASDFDWQARARVVAAARTRRSAPAWRKSARGPPTPAN